MMAFYISLFLLLFNSMVAIFNGLDIWTLGVAGISADASVANIASIFAVLFAALIAAAIASYVFPGLEGKAVYVAFSSFFTGTYVNTILVFSSISASAGGLVMLSIFTLICWVSFLVGMMQLSKGGWEANV